MTKPDGCIRLVEKDIGGGRISKATIDRIAESDGCCLEISGLRQDTFEYLIQKYGKRFIGIKFWKCPRIEDLSPLESLGGIQTLHFFWNQKATRLWNLAKNPHLTRLTLLNFGKASDLSDLASAAVLQSLEFGNSASGKTHVESLEPIGKINTLTELSFNPARIGDERATPLTRLVNLRSLQFSNRLFSTEKIAWLKARLPLGIESERMQPVVRVEFLSGKDTMVTGKGKPFLHSTKDAKRLATYVRDFETLEQHYRNHPELGEPD